MSGIGNGIYIELWLTHQFEAGTNFADDIFKRIFLNENI